MTTARTVTYRYDGAPSTLVSLLTDPSFLRGRCEAAGETNVEVQVEPSPSGLRVVVARDKTMDLPGFAKRLFNPRNRIVDTTVWRCVGERWSAEYEVEVLGIPRAGVLQGSTTITPSDHGCEFVSTFEVAVKLPLVAAPLEKFLALRMEESWRDRCGSAALAKPA